MNAKTAKKLRKQAEKRTVGQPAKSYMAKQHKPKLVRLPDGTVTAKPVTFRLGGSTRGVYQQMKRIEKSGG